MERVSTVERRVDLHHGPVMRTRHRTTVDDTPVAERDPDGWIVGARHQVRRFYLARDRDVSGVSGTGVVAEGVAFTDGTAVVHWYGQHRSTVVWPSVEAVVDIHGHGGATKVVWIDD